MKALQDDLNEMNVWIVRWKIQFNIDKWSVVNLGRENPCKRYIEHNKFLKDH